MQQSDEYRKVYCQKYDQYSQYEIPIAKAVFEYMVKNSFEKLVRPSTEKEDQAGIDVVCIFKNLSCRATPYEPEKYKRFQWCFTLRTRVEVSEHTEFQKIWKGEGADFHARGWIENDKVRDWMLIDLKEVGAALKTMYREGTLQKRCRQLDNKDNQTSFINCDIRDFPKQCLVASTFKV